MRIFALNTFAFPVSLVFAGTAYYYIVLLCSIMAGMLLWALVLVLFIILMMLIWPRNRINYLPRVVIVATPRWKFDLFGHEDQEEVIEDLLGGRRLLLSVAFNFLRPSHWPFSKFASFSSGCRVQPQIPGTIGTSCRGRPGAVVFLLMCSLCYK